VVCLVYLVSLVQPNKQNKPNKPEQPASRTTTSDAGGGFQHMLVDINHAYVRHLPIRLHFAGKSRPFPMTMLARALRFRWDENT
jgi:hypothetical protein